MHIFVGIGALIGGIVTIIDPETPFGITTEILKTGPFKNFLIPGLFLFFVLGVGNIISAICIKLKRYYYPYISFVFSIILPFWIIIQCLIINTVDKIHIVFFIIGILQTFFSFLMISKSELFPSKIIKRFFEIFNVKL